MERTNDRILSALSGLQGTPDWVEVMKWMVVTRDAELKALLITKDEVSMRWLQGSVQTLNAIIEISNNAMEILHRKQHPE